MSAVRRPAAAVAAAALAVSVVSCSSHPSDLPRKPVAVQNASPYESAVLADGATALWALHDADGLRAKDQVADLAPDRQAATVVGGDILGTTSPNGSRGALFLRGGRIVTPLTGGFASTDAFSVELALRADACVTAWGRVLGTTAYLATGREGFEILHFPSQFRSNPCRFGVELWHHDTYLAGCHPRAVPSIGTWSHLAVTYGAGRLSCYDNGRLVGSQRLKPAATFDQFGPLGIGGSGSGYQGPLDGASISDVAVYDHALTAQQVRDHVALLDRSATVTPSP